ncbi:hypothetical protein BOX15_Mlig014904g2 [Macrostomum lignano]|uniref:Uncharacterized protein n=1 Tax=Macrostomum lignano TaxID=282301 RepID=A0A267DE60_9PLAT|nr:hypothetical protein BOX15_Mlig014904g2 [Macrostomum lignano]
MWRHLSLLPVVMTTAQALTQDSPGLKGDWYNTAYGSKITRSPYVHAGISTGSLCLILLAFIGLVSAVYSCRPPPVRKSMVTESDA